MKFEKIHNKGQAKLFESQYVEMLTKTHPLVIWGMYLPIVAIMLIYSLDKLNFSLIFTAAVFVAGMLFWTLFEYMMHRFAFHFVADSPRAQRFIYVLHGNHHEYPRDKERLFMPPVPSLIIACIVFSIFFFVIGNNVYMFFPGFLLGYLMYGTMHFAIHAWNPPYKWMKALWRNHHLHHYKNEQQGFGVSTTLWDRIFGTMFDLKKRKRG